MITADVSDGMSGIEYQVIPNGNYALTISSRRFINLEDSKNYGTCIDWRLVIGSYPPIFDMDCEDYETVTHVSIFQEYDRNETIMIRRPCVSQDDILMIKFDEPVIQLQFLQRIIQYTVFGKSPVWIVKRISHWI